MLSLATDLDLDTRLRRVARALGKTPEQCVLAALKAWLEDHEEALATTRRLGGDGDGVARSTDDFFD